MNLATGRQTAAACLMAMLGGSLAVAQDVPSKAAATLPAAANRKIDFAADIFPLFVAHCTECHGEDIQEGLLRLDARRIALGKGGISGPLVVAGDSAASLLVQRLVGAGDEDRMPLDADPLSDDEIGLVRAWINQGAHWPEGVGSDATDVEKHWAYVAPKRSELPAVGDERWCKTPIDYFALARLEKEGLAPSPETDRARLIRRVSLDLIGLPPTIEEIEAFVADESPDAYEKLVERLLERPQYGERWARLWLDLARYADSNGYQADQLREVWPYRDWVIQAINRDMPFNEFTIEQIAGDLLPGATLDQKIASGMHRATTCNVEAGVDPEENRVNQIVDRVNVTGTIWLGTTLGCAQCHNHKYDPFTQRDFYRLFAYFNNTPLEVKLASGVQYNFFGPKMELPMAPKRLARREQAQQRYDALKKEHDAAIAAVTQAQPDWEEKMTAALVAANGPQDAGKDAQDAVEDEGADDADGPADAAASLPDDIKKILAAPGAKRNKHDTERLRAYFLTLHPNVAAQQKDLAALKKEIDALQPSTTLVMVEMDTPRKTHVLRRGNFLDPMAEVQPGTPHVLHDLPKGAPANRLGLARWLASRDNPLVARVTVNRWWAELFGRGLVATSEDFGTQGEPPTHPKLLDWLAVEFIESGWSTKHVHKLMVMSAAYRQSSRVAPELLRRDPYNKLLARGPRVRLDAETIRDNALAISGLLSLKMGGPPVFPPQPPGIWRHVGRNAPVFEVSPGEDRYRRGIYVVWRRSAPYVSFVNFDAPDRAACCDRRSRTNTPLQALTLLNDPAYVEAAKALARRIVTERAGAGPAEQADFAVRICLARRPTARELEQLQTVYAGELARLKNDPRAAAALAKDFELSEGIDRAEWAAWFYVANVLLNLDETITKG